MNSFYRIGAYLFCAVLFVLCIFLSYKVLLAPSASMDRAIARVCDYIPEAEAYRMERLVPRIHSPWWRDYAKSRLLSSESLLSSHPSELAKLFLSNDLAAYALAKQALLKPEAVDYFSLLPELDAEFAGLIYAIAKGMRINADVFSAFKEYYFKDSLPAVAEYYGEVLAVEALKASRYGTVLDIIVGFGLNKNRWALILVLKGEDPAAYTFLPPPNLNALKDLHKAMNLKDSAERAALLENVVKTASAIRPYQYYRRRIYCEAMWVLGGRDEALRAIRDLYFDAHRTQVSKFRQAALVEIVEFFGGRGEMGHAQYYIFTNAGHNDMMFELVESAATAAARMGHTDKAISMCEKFSGIRGRFNMNFHWPSYPGK